jgi:hypothetical protein
MCMLHTTWVNHLFFQEPLRRVQSDVFHLMKRPRPASKHSFLDVYSSTLSYAFFIRNPDDETRVMKALLRRDFQPLQIKQMLMKVILYRFPSYSA